MGWVKGFLLGVSLLFVIHPLEAKTPKKPQTPRQLFREVVLTSATLPFWFYSVGAGFILATDDAAFLRSVGMGVTCTSLLIALKIVSDNSLALTHLQIRQQKIDGLPPDSNPGIREIWRRLRNRRR